MLDFQFILLRLIFLGFVFGVAGYAPAFTLLSGPQEARLPSTPESPEVEFRWDGSVAPLDELGKYKKGELEDLNEEDRMQKLLEEAFDVWNSVKGSYLRMKIVKDSSATVDAEDNINSIVVQSSSQKTFAAAALPMVDDEASSIRDCDVMIADTKVPAKFMASTLIHEIGHCVGLGHNHTNRNAIMGYTTDQDKIKLTNDDKAGVIYLYTDPAYEGDDKRFLGCAVVSRGSNSSSFLALMMLLCAPLVFAFIRRTTETQ